MKTWINILLLLVIAGLSDIQSQTAVITDDQAYTTGHASTVLDIKSSSKGVLIPRVTLTERGQISSPATGLLVFQTDNAPGFYYYNGSQWSAVGSGVSPDGSETKMNSGTNLTVSGSGTVASPYLITYGAQSVTQAQRNALSGPYAGQFVWCSNCGPYGEYQVYNGSTWSNMCGGTAAPILSTVTTNSVSSILAVTATGGGNVTADGGGTITARGVCWSTSSNPTTSSSKTSDGTGTGSFTSSITGLSPSTTYYVRAYSTNAAGTSYGNQVSFTTITYPSVTTTSASSITQNTASSGGNVTSDGGATVTSRGVCWSTGSSPTLANSYTTDGSGTGSYSSSLTGLSAGTTYYVRAYATSSAGTSYGNEISFTTSSVTVPTLTTNPITNITETSARSGGDITSNGGGSVTVSGICWNTSPNPTTANSKTTDGSSSGYFISNLSGLTAGVTYYVRAYATNSAGTAYGNQVSFIAVVIGSNYGGGKIAYILESSDPGYVAGEMHGLIAATADESTGIQWYNGSNTTTNATLTAIGTGNTNTNTIVASQGAGSYAARLCYDKGGSYSDWYLPSQQEMVKLTIFATAAAISLNTTSYYWSSSEFDSSRAYRVYGGSGTYFEQSKSSSYRVRCLRTF